MPFDSRTKKVATRLAREIRKLAGLVARIPVDREAQQHPEIAAALLGFRRINAVLVRRGRDGTISAAQEARVGKLFVTIGKAFQRKSAPRRKARSRAKR